MASVPMILLVLVAMPLSSSSSTSSVTTPQQSLLAVVMDALLSLQLDETAVKLQEDECARLQEYANGHGLRDFQRGLFVASRGMSSMSVQDIDDCQMLSASFILGFKVGAQIK